jgi:hypothetical protein
MARSSIAKTAARLQWAVRIVWGAIVLAYIIGRLGVVLGPVQVVSRTDVGAGSGVTWVADVLVLLLTVALYQLSRMLGAIAAGDLFSARVIGAFRAFALWLLILSLVSILAPIVASLVAGPGDTHHYEFSFQMRDVLTLGITLILFLVARLLERARTIDEEVREFV